MIIFRKNSSAAGLEFLVRCYRLSICLKTDENIVKFILDYINDYLDQYLQETIILS